MKRFWEIVRTIYPNFEIGARANRLVKLVGEDKAVWLRTHYRSNPAIIGFASDHVYGGRVTPHRSCEGVKLEVRPRGYLSRILDPEKPAVFVHVEGREQAEGGSRWNVEEVEAAKGIVRRLLELGARASSLVNFLVGWPVSTVAVWLALKLFPGKQKRESVAGAALTALVGAIVFWLFKLVEIPFGTVIAWLVWLYLLKRLQGVGWLGAAILAVLTYIVNAVFGFFLPTLL